MDITSYFLIGHCHHKELYDIFIFISYYPRLSKVWCRGLYKEEPSWSCVKLTSIS